MSESEKLRTRLSTKGQVILPKPLRDRLGWTPGTVLDVEDTPHGVLLRAASQRQVAATRIEDVAGMLAPHCAASSRAIDEMNTAIDAEVRRRHASGRY